MVTLDMLKESNKSVPVNHPTSIQRQWRFLLVTVVKIGETSLLPAIVLLRVESYLGNEISSYMGQVV